LQHKTLLRELLPVERRKAIEAALMRMMSLPEAARPFVVLSHRPSQRFVQFCGSTTRPLTFDVPALGTTTVLGQGGDADIYESAAALALMTLGSLVYRSFVKTEDPDAFWTAIERTPHLVLEESFDTCGEVRAS
jgi:hypothetical protein